MMMMTTNNLKLIALLAGSAFVCVAQAADGSVNFTGNIIDNTCAVSTGSKTVTVPLGDVQATAFSGVGSTASPTNFSILLEACPVAITTAAVKFDGPKDPINSELLQLTENAGAEADGVAVGIYEQDTTTLIPIASKSKNEDVATTATFNFVAKYVATKATIRPGTAGAVSEFTITYN
jgi:major type 1 subunit fimbrin (pilin)